ncbi:MAG: DUF1501 domain-containing protein [Armatimonadetes bacterium]|nr:DUF1501 domain-containing protein [Armatimonadota bacterium]
MNDHSCDSFKDAMSRRSALKLGALGLVPWLLSGSALSQIKIDSTRRGHALVVLFLRGGSDGLNMMVPYADDHYYKARPSLAIARPNDLRVKEAARSVALNDYFALHPSLAPLKKWFEAGSLALVPAVGSQDMTRSHFEAMSAMERGAPTGHSGEPSGWLARYLNKTASAQDTPLRAVAWADRMPDSLRGAPAPLVVQSITDFHLDADEDFVRELKLKYQNEPADPSNLMHSAGANTLHALDRIERLDPKNYKASSGATYPISPLGAGFREVACLLKSDLGLEIACLEETGWDTHFAQGADTGVHASQLDKVAKSIDAFMTDLGPRAKEMTLIVMTEFGRRVQENASLGTDHGRASVMMALGDVDGGKILGQWPGLAPNQLDDAGDIKPVNDYRTVLTDFLSPKMPEIANIWG